MIRPRTSRLIPLLSLLRDVALPARAAAFVARTWPEEAPSTGTAAPPARGAIAVTSAPRDPFTAGAGAALAEIEQLRGALREAEARFEGAIGAVDPRYRESARNLVHYVALRQVDLRPLQSQLASMGLSSLGRSEAHVSATLAAVERTLRALLGLRAPGGERPLDAEATARSTLREHTRALFGDADPPAAMVTMPSKAATDYGFVRALLAENMHVMRVNCAHDDADAWIAMTGHLRRAEAELGRSCRVLFDLPGPKLRTLGLEPGPRVLRLRPDRDVYGKVVRPAALRLRAMSDVPAGVEPAEGEIWVDAEWARGITPGDVLQCKDARGLPRKLQITATDEHGASALAYRTVYLREDTELLHRRRGHLQGSTRPVRVRARPSAIELRQGDVLRLVADGRLGHPARVALDGTVVEPAAIACAGAGVVEKLRVGDPVFFDDGKIGGVVESVDLTEARLRVTLASPGGSKLRGERGVNLPATELDAPAFGPADLAALAVAVQHADLVGLSFTRSADDVRELHERLAELGGERLGTVIKIESRHGFERLPAILLEALGRPPVGVMIARGDLAVECGFERLAELQEEILWLCEAAHVPTIWATQVLETLAKKGHASRAEITDAAMAERAECVMLNKGPHVVLALRTLGDILGRMRGHQQKKSSMLRPLRTPRLDVGPKDEPPRGASGD